MAKYNEAIQIILNNEGGYQKHPSDRGNYNSRGILVGTKYGISAKTLERWKGYPVRESDMKNLSLLEAEEIYHVYYWLPIKGNQITDQDTAEIIFDHAVNAGVGGASKIVQQVLNSFGAKLRVDGEIGDQTLYVLNVADQGRFFDAFKNERLNYYRSISSGSNAVFSTGWIKRVMSFKKKKW